MNGLKKFKTALACFLSATMLLSAFTGVSSVFAEDGGASGAANNTQTGDSGEMTYFQAYPKAAYETISPDYSLTVNGQSVDTVAYFEYTDGVYRYSYAHLAYEGTAQFAIKNLHGDITAYNLSPHSYGIDATVSGDTITFSLEQKDSRYLVLRSTAGGKQYELIIACDPQIDYGLEALKQGNFVNVVEDLGFDNTGATKLSQASGTNATGVLQDAINELSRQGGGTLYFPAGTYSFVYLDAKDDVTIYLDAGAYLYGTGDRTDYTWNATGQNGRQGRRLIHLRNARNFSLIGPGTIDGNIISLAYPGKNNATVPAEPAPDGFYPTGWEDFRTGIIDGDGAKNIVLKGITVKETTGWTFNIVDSDNIEITNVKMLNDYEIVHSDGYDLVSCQKVLIDDCLGVCGDDVFCPKAASSDRTMRDYLITDGVAYACGGAGCKIGVQSKSRTDNIVFDNIDVIQGYRAFCIAHDEGQGEWSNITFRNIRTEEIWIEGEPDSDGQYRPAAFILWTLGGGQGLVHDVTVENCSIENSKGLRGIIQGQSAAGKLSDITIKNMTIDGMAITQSNHRAKIDVGSNVENLSFESDRLRLTETVRYEAEVSRDRTGSADAMVAEGASSGWVMKNIGSSSSVTLSVFAETAGLHEIEVFYCLRGNSQMKISVNNMNEQTYDCAGADETETSPYTIKLTADLNRGMNSITFSGVSDTRGEMINLDKIEVSTLTIDEKTAVSNMVAAIDALPVAEAVTDADSESVKTTINSYNALADIQKVFVNNVAKLAKVEKTLTAAGVELPELKAIAPNDGEDPNSVEAFVAPNADAKTEDKGGSILLPALLIAGGVLLVGAVVTAVVLKGKKSNKKQNT